VNTESVQMHFYSLQWISYRPNWNQWATQQSRPISNCRSRLFKL